jgi:YD repeat-containing protein
MRRPLAISVLLIMLGAAAAMSETARYTYDAAGRLTRVEYGGGRGFAYRYDANGNLLAREPLGTRRRSIRAAKPAPAPQTHDHEQAGK